MNLSEWWEETKEYYKPIKPQQGRKKVKYGKRILARRRRRKMNQQEGKKYGHFKKEITFEIDVEYAFIELGGETEILMTRANIESYQKEIDIFPFLPLHVVNDIDCDIEEDIDYDQR